MTTTLPRKRYDELERTIEHALQTFVNVGNALREIRDEGFYTVEYDTFEAYCKARWGFERQHAYRLIDAALVTDNLRMSPKGDKALPSTERQARPLTKLKPEEQPVAWELAVEKAGDGNVTAAIVEEAVAELSDDSPPVEVCTKKSKDSRVKNLRDACRSIRAARKISSGFEYSELRVILNSIRKLLQRIENDEQEEAA